MTLDDGSALKIDFLWQKERLALDKRDQLLRLAGFEPVRFTGRQVALEKEWVTRTLLALACRADDVVSRRAGAQAA